VSNRLADETSPYLLQHADNPVDWYPWGDEAFARARREDRPVLLSIGYSSCHWCHVMAHESFENEQIAALMNELFVNIKVDREERPDVDSIYMQAVVAISGHGGWPMTVFLTPAAEPYFGGTYFPPEDRQGMRGLPFVLHAAAQAYRERRTEVSTAAAQLRAVLEPVAPPSGTLSPLSLASAVTQLVAQADMRNGGFGGAPKFPHPAALDLLLRRHRAGGADRRALDVVTTALDRMARGGVYDQVGGGFHRYAVDATWSVPHFEKMLYDNAQLVPVYLHAFQLTGDIRWRRVVEQTLDYVLREMVLPDGGFASSQDADSAAGEGTFFAWSPAELVEALGDEDGSLAARLFGVSAGGNFEHATTVLSLPYPVEHVAHSLQVTPDALYARLDSIRAGLLSARAGRAAPARDDKVLTSWNALMLAAFAEAGAALDRPDWVAAARRNADFLLAKLRVEGVLQRTWKDGRAKITGFLEDSAFLADALVTLYEATGQAADLAAARELVADALRRFDGGGVLYDTASDAQPLLVRPRTLEDNPIPAGQSSLASALLRLAALSGDAALRQRALDIIGPLAAAIARTPLAVASLAVAADRALARSREVAIAGDAGDARTLALVRTVHSSWTPDTVLAWGAPDGVELLADRPLVDGAPAAYVCESFACQLPVTDPAQLASLLAAPTS
jgi:uncharacterized protein YyaL (SSP411 family)